MMAKEFLEFLECERLKFHDLRLPAERDRQETPGRLFAVRVHSHPRFVLAI